MKRFTAHRKRAVVQRITDGVVSKAEAMCLFGLSREEIDSWQANFSRFGIQGLLVQNTKALRLLA